MQVCKLNKQTHLCLSSRLSTYSLKLLIKFKKEEKFFFFSQVVAIENTQKLAVRVEFSLLTQDVHYSTFEKITSLKKVFSEP